MISTGSAQFSPPAAMCVCSYNCGRLCHTRHLGHSPPVLHHASCCCCHTGQSPLCTDSIPRSNCFLNLDRIRSAVTGQQLCKEMDLRNSLLCLKRCSLTIVRHLVGLLSCKTFFQGSFLNWDNFASIYVQPLRKGNGWVEGVSTLACIKIAALGAKYTRTCTCKHGCLARVCAASGLHHQCRDREIEAR